jgi:predicted small secreted protein
MTKKNPNNGRRFSMRQLITLLIILSFLFLTGCQTFKGLGKDVQKAGKWVEKKADKN